MIEKFYDVAKFTGCIVKGGVNMRTKLTILTGLEADIVPRLAGIGAISIGIIIGYSVCRLKTAYDEYLSKKES